MLARNLRRLPFLLILPALLALSACANLGTLKTLITPTSQAVVLAAVDLALGQTVFNNPATNQPKAVVVKAIASAILADTANPTATIGLIESDLNARIAKVNPADASAFILFTGQLQMLLNKQVGSPASAITSTSLVAIAGLATEVIRVCTLYGA